MPELNLPIDLMKFIVTNQVADCLIHHHHLDGKILRKRTDSLTDETAAQLIITLRGLGYKETEFLG